MILIYAHIHIHLGGLGMWDLRMTKKKVSVLAGSSGSIRDLHMTPSGKHVYIYIYVYIYVYIYT
jgi:hypothetical protein